MHPKIAIIKKSDNNKCWQVCGAIEIHIFLVYTLWKTAWWFLKYFSYLCDLAYPVLFYLGMPILLSSPDRILPIPQGPTQIPISQAYIYLETELAGLYVFIWYCKIGLQNALIPIVSDLSQHLILSDFRIIVSLIGMK